jgi:orotidine-5'-phosphate decarboxylase
VTAFFDELGVDAVTLHPYLGWQALQPFLDRADKGCIVLCKTSNPNSGEFQDLITVNKQRVWEVVAKQVAAKWNSLGNCLLVVGATYPNELARVRQLTGAMTLLVPGIGSQGGDVKAILEAGLNKEMKGLIINSSRNIIFSKNPSISAKNLRDEINLYRR